jgi:hypothetical protein
MWPPVCKAFHGFSVNVPFSSHNSSQLLKCRRAAALRPAGRAATTERKSAPHFRQYPQALAAIAVGFTRPRDKRDRLYLLRRGIGRIGRRERRV